MPYQFAPFGPGLLQAVSTTGLGGYTLVNGTGTIISWTAPNDGQLHRFMIFSNIVITTLEVGGTITYLYTPPGQTQQSHTLQGAGQAAGSPLPTNLQPLTVAPNTQVLITQSAALTGGAAILYAEIWAS